jgi:AraC-like DNA-binding protein
MTSQRVTFSSSNGEDAFEDGFATYHDLYAPVADVTRLGDVFSAAVTAHRLDSILAFDRRLQNVSHHRCPRRVARNAFDHFTVQLALRGNFLIHTDAGERSVDRGALALVDMTRWMRTDTYDTNLLTLSVPRVYIESLVGNAERLHGAVLPASRTTLLSDFVLSFLRSQTELTSSDRSRVERVVTELLAIALSDRGLDPGSIPEAASEVIARTHAKRFIDANLHCTPDDVAQGIGRSRSVLYRAFQPLGGLSSYIQGRRLLRLRSLLLDVQEARQISELAAVCGFSSVSHCVRAFKSRFGLSPGEYRAVRAGAFYAAAQEEAHEVFAQWWGGLR